MTKEAPELPLYWKLLQKSILRKHNRKVPTEKLIQGKEQLPNATRRKWRLGIPIKLGLESHVDDLINNCNLDSLMLFCQTLLVRRETTKKSLISHINEDASVSSIKESTRIKINEENHEDEIPYDCAL